MPGEAKPVLLSDFIILLRHWWTIKKSVSQTALSGTFLPAWKGQVLVSQMCDVLHNYEEVTSSQKEDPQENSRVCDSFFSDDAVRETSTLC